MAKDFDVTRAQVARLLKKHLLNAVSQLFTQGQKKDGVPDKQQKVYPYLLRVLLVDHPNEEWCSYIATFQIEGVLYLTAVMHWHNRDVLFI